jgi:hypothetical protein
VRFLHSATVKLTYTQWVNPISQQKRDCVYAKTKPSLYIKSMASSVGTATGYGLDTSGSITVRGKIFFFSIAPRPALEPTKTPIQWVPRAFSLGVKRQELHAPDHSSESSNVAKNVGVITPLPHKSSWRSA